MNKPTWKFCLQQIEKDLPEQQYNTWIRPLNAIEDENSLCLLAPNKFVMDWVNNHFLEQIQQIVDDLQVGLNSIKVRVEIGGTSTFLNAPTSDPKQSRSVVRSKLYNKSNLNNNYTFETFIEGKSNQLARIAAQKVADTNEEEFINPLFIMGGVGLGKTHLMQAIGNRILENDPSAKVAYLHSERFVQDMVKALQHNAIEEFKCYYRSLNALLIDDIQFFAGKERSRGNREN